MFSDEVNSLREQQIELHFQMKVYYDDDDVVKEELVPGRFRNPDNLYYGLDQFMEMDVYEMLSDIVQKLELATEDQLKIALSALNNLNMPSKYNGIAVRAEVIDLRDGSVITSAED